MRRRVPLAVLLLALLSGGGTALAQDGGLADLIEGAPAAATAPDSAPGAPSGFPALAGCESSLAGLAFGDPDAVVAQLERRMVLWEEATFGSVPAFRSLAQARFALDCFERRLNLLAAFIPASPEAREAAARFVARWGDRAAAFLAGDMPGGVDAGAWWSEADQALALLAATERTVGRAVADGAREREAVLVACRAALAEFRRIITEVERLDVPIAQGQPGFWGRTMAWRALQVGLAFDGVQLADLRTQPQSAHALLTSATPPSVTEAVAAELTALLLRTAALRQVRGTLEPGAPRDWSTGANRTRLAEELYLLHAIEQGLGAWVDRALEERAEKMRLSLQLQHMAAVAGGMRESESRILRDAEWQGFLEDQARARYQSVERWSRFLARQRQAVIEAALKLPPPE